MNYFKSTVAALLLASIVSAPVAAFAGDKTTEKPKPYPLKVCIISGDKLGEMGEPFVYVHEGREIKLCCKGCLKDFKKEPAKYLKKIDEEVAKAKKKTGSSAK